jgi:putative oxidoreductase
VNNDNQSPSTFTSRPKLIDWVIRVAVAFVFISSGLEKFSIGPGAEWIRMFAKIGFGDWFRYLTGVLEVLGGLLLVVPIATRIGAALLVAVMAGAILFHIFILGDPFSSVINLGLIVGILVAARRRKVEDESLTSLELRRFANAEHCHAHDDFAETFANAFPMALPEQWKERYPCPSGSRSS